MDFKTQSISKSLRHQFKAQRIALSKISSDSEAVQINAVINGVRCACLLSSCIASKTSLIALQRAFSKEDFETGDNIAIVVHQASQQIFIVNVKLFLDRYRTAKGPLLYYAIDTDIEESNRVQYEPPQYLQDMLERLISSLTKLDLSSTPILLLNSDNSSSSIGGVALAGWMLEYHIVYFFHGSFFTSSCQIWSEEEHFSECDNWSDESRENKLSGIPLFLIKANTSDGLTLYQYTFPISLLRQVALSLSVNDSIEDVMRAIERCSHSSLRIHYEIVTKNRIIM